MRHWFQKRREPQLGIEIDGEQIRLIELSYKAKKIQVEAFGIGASLDAVIKQSGTQTRRVAIALPTQEVMIKKIQLPRSDIYNDIETPLKILAERHIPFSLAEVHLDFQVLTADREQTDLIDVILVAVHKQKVIDAIAPFARAGLEVCCIDVALFAIQNATERAEALSVGTDPFVGMTFAPHVDRSLIAMHLPSLMGCCGVALRGIFG